MKGLSPDEVKGDSGTCPSRVEPLELQTESSAFSPYGGGREGLPAHVAVLRGEFLAAESRSCSFA